MSIARCPYCDTTYDQDFNVEHEEECKEEQDIFEAEHGLKCALDDVSNLSGDYRLTNLINAWMIRKLNKRMELIDVK